MRITIFNEESLKARQAAQLLAGIVILRDGLALTSQGLSEMSEQSDLMRETLDYLESIGQVFVTPSIEQPPYQSYETLTLYDCHRMMGVLLRQPALEFDLEFISLSQGSTIGVLKELGKDIAHRLFRVLTSAKSLLPNADKNNERDFENTALEVIREQNLPENVEYTAVGFTVVSALVLQPVFSGIKATQLKVEKTFDEEDAPNASASANA